MTWELALGFVAGLVISTVTAPVGVSGAVFLLPVQLDILRVPSPAVTPTNLLFNVVTTPGALLRYRAQGQLGGPLARQLIGATLPGVVIGAVVRVYLVRDVAVFRLIAAAVLLPLGVWLCARSAPRRPGRPARPLSRRTITVLALLVGVVAASTASAAAPSSGRSWWAAACPSPPSRPPRSPPRSRRPWWARSPTDCSRSSRTVRSRRTGCWAWPAGWAAWSAGASGRGYSRGCRRRHCDCCWDCFAIGLAVAYVVEAVR